MSGSEWLQHAGEDLEAEVLLIAETVGSTLDDTDLVVESLDEAERDLVLGAAVCRYAVPVPFDHPCELLVGLEALPLQRVAPVLEEAPGPALPGVVPELSEGLFEQVGSVDPPVRGEQELERSAALECQVLAVRKQGVLLPL